MLLYVMCFLCIIPREAREMTCLKTARRVHAAFAAVALDLRHTFRLDCLDVSTTPPH